MPQYELVMNDPETPEKPRQEEQADPQDMKPNTAVRMPFDTSDLNRIPTATEADPPYRDWWVDDER